ncbi:hypothetical protein MAM1_0153c06719 [Mucor ambiguus]|uniref:G-protein coupled receptors family 2 profile 2 domain-containing protein n=1 Tax=Mucor ambiguus TaxID=91626 RepID=A0A0C9M9U4_9FUNG|nr:hypothetical protein MAM1_0153c06719 [Mucor ambiguus]
MLFEIGSMAEQQWNFTASQWLGLIATGEAASAVSFASGGCVLLLHAFMTWYRPVVVNRLSLRMIVVSVIFNMVYCACQLVADDISNQSNACRVIAYVMIASDTMSCMCLAMVGLNLVMIFVLKVSRSIKIEILYYLIVLASGVIVCVVPVYVGTPKGPKNKREEASCWQVSHFDQVMWYYAWLLFSSVFAALCAAISIRFVVKKQENFNGALDMFTKRNQKDLHTMAIIKRYAADNTDVFQKIARRCICYPIGFMISCIYFTDPAIRAMAKESIHKLKQRYVYDYFSIKYQPGTDPETQTASQYPKILKIVPVTDDVDRTPEYVQEVRDRYFSQDAGIHRQQDDIIRIERSMLDPLDHHTIDPTQFQSRPPSHKPDMPTITVQTSHRTSGWETSPEGRRYSVLNVTSVNGHTYTPNEEVIDNVTDSKRRQKRPTPAARAKTIPMHRVDNTIDVGVNMTRDNHHQHRYLKYTEKVETLVPYKFPVMARMIHWVLVSLFRVKEAKAHGHDSDDDDSDDDSDFFAKSDRRQDGPSRAFRDYTDGSNPGSPKLMRRNDSISFHPDVELKSVAPLSKIPPFYTQQHDTGSTSSINAGRLQAESSTTTRKRSLPDVLFLRRQSATVRYTKSLRERSESPEFPLRRVSSINVASLQRSPDNKKPVTTASIQTSPPLGNSDSEQGTQSNSSSSKPSIGLSKMLNRGRSMSFSWSRLTNTKGKYALSGSPLNLEQPLTNTDSSSSVGYTSHPDAPSVAATAASGGGIGGPTRSLAMGDVHHPDHTPMADMDVDHHSIHVPAEPELSYYPKELSPRPRSQYKKPPGISKSSMQDRRESTDLVLPNSSHVMSKATSRLSKRKQQNRGSSIISDNEQSLYLNELFYGVTPTYQHVLGLEDVMPGHDSMQSELSRFESDKKSPDTKRISDLSMDQQEGFAQGYTSIEFILNWQESNVDDDSHRIVDISEPWDLQQQLKQQFELADDIAHM